MSTDNVPFTGPTGRAAADNVTYSGDTDAQIQVCRLVHVSGSEGAKTVTEVFDTAGLKVSTVGGVTPAFGSGANGATVLRVALATDSPGIAGTVAHDAADSGDPLKVGARARSSEGTPVATGDRSDLFTDLAGKLLVLPYANPENFVSGAITAAMTGTTSTSLVAVPGAGLRNYITTIIASCAHATQGTDIIIQDGSGGTTLMTIPAAAVYGGSVITLPVPLRQPTANTALYCANVTAGSSTKVSAVGYKGV